MKQSHARRLEIGLLLWASEALTNLAIRLRERAERLLDIMKWEMR